MQEKQLIESQMNLYSCVDDSGQQKFVIEGVLSGGEYELEGIDYPIEIESIPADVKLTLTTGQPVIIKGNVAGKLIVKSHNNANYDVQILGNVLPSGEIETMGEKDIEVKGNVAGKLHTTSSPVVDGYVLPTADIKADLLLIRGTYPAGKYKLPPFDFPVILDSVPQGVDLEVSTSAPFKIKNNVNGKLIINSHNNVKYSFEILGNATSTAEIHTMGEKSVTLKGNLDGRLYTRSETLINGSISKTAKVSAEKLTCHGIIDESADIKSKQPLVYSQKLNPGFAKKEECNKNNNKLTTSENKLIAAMNSNSKQPRGVISYGMPPSPFAKHKNVAAEKRETKIFQKLGEQAMPLGRKGTINSTRVEPSVVPSQAQNASPFNNKTLKKSSSEPLVGVNKRPREEIKPTNNKTQPIDRKASVVAAQSIENKTKQAIKKQRIDKKPKRIMSSNDVDVFASFLEDDLTKSINQNDHPTLTIGKDAFDSLKQEILLETMEARQDKDALDIFDDEINEYIKKDREIPVESAAAEFELKRLELANNVGSFLEALPADFKVPLVESAEPLFLRVPQVKALNALRNSLDQEMTKGYFKLPTGVGKTVLMKGIFKAMDRPRALFIESRTQLIEQTVSELQKNFPECTIGVFDGKNKELGCDITVTTYQSLQSQYQKEVGKRDLKPGMFDLVFCDEAHNALGKGSKEPILEFFNSAYVYGLSATDAYNTVREKGSFNSLRDLFQNPIFEYSLPEAIIDKALAPVQNIHVNVHCKLDVNAIRKRSKAKKNPESNIEEENDFNLTELGKQLNHENINRIPALLYANGLCTRTGKRLLGQSGIVFGIGIEHSKKIADEFNKLLSNHPHFKSKGITPAMAISGDMSPELRRQIIKRHKEGKIAVLCCDKYCTEGYDNPRVKVIINAKPTKAQIPVIQGAGRATRLYKDRTATIIDLMYEGLDQVTISQFLGGKVCGGDYIKKDTNKKKNMDLIDPPETVPFTINDPGLKMLQAFDLVNGMVVEQDIKGMDPIDPPSQMSQEFNVVKDVPFIKEEAMPSLTRDYVEPVKQQYTQPVSMFRSPEREQVSMFDIGCGNDELSAPLSAEELDKLFQDGTFSF